MGELLQIIVELPDDRRSVGRLTLKDGAGKTLAGPFDVLGKSDNLTAVAHGNAGRDPKQPYGDTPKGQYEVPAAVATGAGTAYNPDSYGPNGGLVLLPVNGEALHAQRNGRTGLMIHGGKAGAGGRLRPTHGCLRLSDSNMSALMSAIRARATAGTRPICEAVRLNIAVGGEAAPDTGEDAGDPPPGIDAIIGPQPPPIVWHP